MEVVFFMYDQTTKVIGVGVLDIGYNELVIRAIMVANSIKDANLLKRFIWKELDT